MNKAYQNLSYNYDSFTSDVPYDDFLTYYEQIFKKLNVKPKLILDLGCGTGTLTIKMAEKGYEMIGVDASIDMLCEAQNKAYSLTQNRPIFLHQSMENLDLFGTIDACISSLDCINYITCEDKLSQTFKLVSNFLNPDSAFIFDINTITKLKSLDKTAYVRENDDTFLVWQADFENNLCTYTFDIFEKKGDLYTRSFEEHIERAYEVKYILNLLEKCGFYDIKCYDNFSFNAGSDDNLRVFFVCKSKGENKK